MLRTMLVAATAAWVAAAPASAATAVYTSEAAFAAANPGVPRITDFSGLAVTRNAQGGYEARIAGATFTSPARLIATQCYNGNGTCLLSTSVTDAGAVSACADAGIVPGDPFYGACLEDVRFSETPTTTGITVSGTELGIEVDVYRSHSDATLSFEVNGQAGSVSFGRTAFLGFSGDAPLNIALLSNATLAVRTVYARAAVAAVPEPASWAAMVLGVGATGGVLRARRRRTGVLPA